MEINMIRLNDYLDGLSIIKVLSFFLFLMLIFTLIPMIFSIDLGSLFFKFLIYIIMLLFFFYKFKKMDLGEKSEDSFLFALKNDFNSLFEVSGIYNISFIVIANILFVSAIYFVLKYFSNLSLISFDSPLFGDFSSISISVLILYFLTIVILSPIIEEVLFRGIFLRRFNKALNNISLAILLSSLLFGICHNFGGILGAILFGICVSILYIKSKNILVPIFAHFLNNILSFLLALSGAEHFIQGNFIAVILIIVLAVVSNFVLFKAILNEWPKNMA